MSASTRPMPINIGVPETGLGFELMTLGSKFAIMYLLLYVAVSRDDPKRKIPLRDGPALIFVSKNVCCTAIHRIRLRNHCRQVIFVQTKAGNPGSYPAIRKSTGKFFQGQGNPTRFFTRRFR
jgi:hypothetical protein